MKQSRIILLVSLLLGSIVILGGCSSNSDGPILPPSSGAKAVGVGANKASPGGGGPPQTAPTPGAQ